MPCRFNLTVWSTHTSRDRSLQQNAAYVSGTLGFHFRTFRGYPPAVNHKVDSIYSIARRTLTSPFVMLLVSNSLDSSRYVSRSG